MRKLMAVVAAVFGLTPLAVINMTAPAVAQSKMHCGKPIFYAKDDPILNHDAPAGSSMHQHTFFINPALAALPNPNTANWSDLSGKASTCVNTDDTSSVWAPTLWYTKTHRPVPLANFFRVYYRPVSGVGGPQIGVGRPLPKDLRMVSNSYNWACGDGKVTYPSIPAAKCVNRPGVNLTLHVDFPSCWDGALNDHAGSGNTADFDFHGVVHNHLAFFDPDSNRCPRGFPVPLTAVRVDIQYDYRGDGTDVQLSSDVMGTGVATPGTTAHVDYWNTWVQGNKHTPPVQGRYNGMIGMTRDCVNRAPKNVEECGRED